MVGVRAAAAAAVEPEIDIPPFYTKFNGQFISKLHPHHRHQQQHHHHYHQMLEMAPVERIGAGLTNLGNTCFLNSVIQCLTYTPPLAAYLQANLHKGSCQVRGFCAMCALENHAKQALSSAPGRVLSPTHLVKNLRAISRSFQMWRQEDAHEYMRYLIEALQKCCPREASPGSSHKNYIERVFGGRLRSQVKCTQCSHCSNTYDPFLDLSLEIVKAESLAKALARFTAVEVLDGNNKYQCSKCKKKVRAFKQFTIDHAPHVLTIQLKRFSTSGGFGGKIDKKVQFDRTFDIKPFVNRGKHTEMRYSLYAVLVHSGWSTHSGHYYCFVRTTADTWHVLDDSRVSQVSEKTVLDQKAYMLFYIRDLKIPAGMIDCKKTTDFGTTKLNGNEVSVTKPYETSTFKLQNSEEMMTSLKSVGITAANVNKNSSTCMSDNQHCIKEPPGFEPKASESVADIGFTKLSGYDPTTISSNQLCQNSTDSGFTRMNGNLIIGKDKGKSTERIPNNEAKHGLSSAMDIGNYHPGVLLNTASAPRWVDAEEHDLGHSESNGESQLMDEWAKESNQEKSKNVRKKQTAEQNVIVLYHHNNKRRKMSGEVGKSPFQATSGSKSQDEMAPSAQVKKHRKKPWIFGLKLFLRRNRFKQIRKFHQDVRKTTK